MRSRVVDSTSLPVAAANTLRTPKLAVYNGGGNTDLWSSSGPTTINVVTSSSAHTMGAWAEVVASTTSDLYGLSFLLSNNQTNGADTSTLMDIGVGAAGSEVVVAPANDIGFQAQNSGIINFHVIPVYIPSGSRVAIRAQSIRISQTIGVTFHGGVGFGRQRLPQGLPTKLVSYGGSSSTSNLTTLTAPGSLNAKGAWTQLTAATNEPLQALIVQISNGATPFWGNANILVDVGYGAAGSEVVLASNIYVNLSSNEFAIRYGQYQIVPVDLPAGVRLAARYQRSASTNIQTTCSVIGVPK